jgi:Ca2+/Na+ antiporter
MSISNSIGSNTFDILMCLGLPWLVKGAILAASSGGGGDPFIQINSGGLEYSAMFLMGSLLLLYGLLAANSFYLDRRVGFACAALYASFLALASLFELNVFFTVNAPTCPIIID